MATQCRSCLSSINETVRRSPRCLSCYMERPYGLCVVHNLPVYRRADYKKPDSTVIVETSSEGKLSLTSFSSNSIEDAIVS